MKPESYDSVSGSDGLETPSSILVRMSQVCTPPATPCSDASSQVMSWGRRLHEIKLCLLICSMFPKYLPFEDLFIFAMGLEMFENARNLLEVRDWIHELIQTIIRHCLGVKIVLCGEEDEYRYVKFFGSLGSASRIPSRFQLIVNHETVMEEWSKTNCYQNCDGLSLVLYRIREYPVNLECPNLAILQIQHREDSQSLPFEFFKGMKELRVLSLDVPSLPRSINVLRNLRTLRLKVLTSENMFAIGGLTNLEFLSISTLRLTDIPKEMGQLVNLRLLDLRKMNLAYIPPSVLSRLSKLEELYLPLSFRWWEGCAEEKHDDYDEWESREEDNYDDEEKTIASLCKINYGETSSAILSEIVSLSLNTLQISIPKASMLPKRSPMFRNLQRFKILMQKNILNQSFRKGSMTELQLGGDAHDIKESGICDLLCRTEDLSLIRVRNLKNVMYQLEDEYGFPQLKKMIIAECDELEHLIDTTEKQTGFRSFCKLEILHLSMLSDMKEIWHGTTRSIVPWLENLRKISIRFCHKLKYVFPLSVARGLIRLKSIEILNCNEIEEIFCKTEADDSINDQYFVVEELHLHALPKLVGFLAHKEDLLSNLEDATTNQSLINNEVDSDDTEEQVSPFDVDFRTTSRTSSRLKNKLKKLRLFTHQLVPNKQEPINAFDSNLHSFPTTISSAKVSRETTISYMEMYCAFSSKLMEKRLERLEKLKIAFCASLKVIFSFNKNHDATIGVLNSLKELELYGLRNLMHIWFQIPQEIIGFQNLQLLVLSECHNSYVLSPRVAKLLVQLQKIQISRCENMEEIVIKEDENADEEEAVMDKIVFPLLSKNKKKIVFPQLKVLELQHMLNLRSFYGGISAIELPLLESLKLNQCNKMESFSYGSTLSTPMLKGILINERLYSLTGDINATMKRKTNEAGILRFSKRFRWFRNT